MKAPVVKSIARYFSRRGRTLNFGLVSDPRKHRGRRWSTQSLLMASLVGMMAMERCFRGIERVTRDLDGCRRKLDIARRVPDSTLARFFSRLDDEEGLRQVLVDDIKRAKRRKALEPVTLPISVLAIDGKTLWTGHEPVDDPACQTQKDDDERADYRIHTLHAVVVTAASQPCIDQLLVPGKTNEMGSLPEFVERLVEAYGSGSLFEVISVDAGMTSIGNARMIATAELRYMMALKDNQPTLLAEAKRLCGWGAHKQAGHRCAASTPWRNYRGSKTRRELFRSNEIRGWPEWESARQVWRVKQTTKRKNGSVVVENRYFVTSLPHDRLSDFEILELVRLHWGVENGCHWTMDVILGEDDHPMCTRGKAIRMLSWMRLLAYNMLRGLRDRYLRSPKSRVLPWKDIKAFITQALQHPPAWVGLRCTKAEPTTL